MTLIVLGLVAGCSQAPGPTLPKFQGDTVPVSGVVTLDGKPFADVGVTFNYDGSHPDGFLASSGQTDSTGKYVLRAGEKVGTPPGRYKVIISRLATADGTPFREDPAAGMDFEQARLAGVIKEMVPAKYSDPLKGTLTIEVTPDQKDPINFALDSK